MAEMPKGAILDVIVNAVGSAVTHWGFGFTCLVVLGIVACLLLKGDSGPGRGRRRRRLNWH